MSCTGKVPVPPENATVSGVRWRFNCSRRLAKRRTLSRLRRTQPPSPTRGEGESREAAGSRYDSQPAKVGVCHGRIASRRASAKLVRDRPFQPSHAGEPADVCPSPLAVSSERSVIRDRGGGRAGSVGPKRGGRKKSVRAASRLSTRPAVGGARGGRLPLSAGGLDRRAHRGSALRARLPARQAAGRRNCRLHPRPGHRSQPQESRRSLRATCARWSTPCFCAATMPNTCTR